MKHLTTICLLLLSVSMLQARPQTRAVVVDTVCNAPLKEMLHVTNRFCRQFQACPDSLFDWAYIGLASLVFKKPVSISLLTLFDGTALPVPIIFIVFNIFLRVQSNTELLKHEKKKDNSGNNMGEMALFWAKFYYNGRK